MGFEHVKVDGLSISDLKRETEQYNQIYFGKNSYVSNGKNDKGQLQSYRDAKKKFMDEQFAIFRKYFIRLNWDVSDDITMRANEHVYIYFDLKAEILKFCNGKVEKTYRVSFNSLFRENPHFYINERNKGNLGYSYTNKYGCPTKPNDIKKQLEDLKEIVEFNQGLDGKYEFKLVVDKNPDNTSYTSEIEWEPYVTIEQLLDEISEKEF